MRLVTIGSPSISVGDPVVLDAARAGAALMVFLSHWSILTGNGAYHLESLGRIGVLVFFVLSGYLIAATTARATLSSYAVARTARLYSVVVPMLVLLPIIDWLSVHLGAPESRYDFSTQFFFSATFATRWWFLEVPTFGDGPFWSLSYEAGFYVVWAAIWFGGRYRRAAVLAACLLVGPKVLLLFPIWLAGVALYLSGARLTALGVALALPAAVILGMLGRQITILPAIWGDSSILLSDWLRGGACLLMLASLMALVKLTTFPLATWIATRSFTLYLLHFPLMGLLVLVFGRAYASTAPGSVLIGAATLAACLALGSLIEPTHKSWRRFLTAVFISRPGVRRL